MTYFIQWLPGYGWHVFASNNNGKSGITITGFSGPASLNHVLTWCGSTPVTILPSTR